jgi:hypothetical protein
VILKVYKFYGFMQKYKNYLRIRRFIPLSMVSPLTSNDLSRMAYAFVTVSKSTVIIIPGLIV